MKWQTVTLQTGDYWEIEWWSTKEFPFFPERTKKVFIFEQYVHETIKTCGKLAVDHFLWYFLESRIHCENGCNNDEIHKYISVTTHTHIHISQQWIGWRGSLRAVLWWLASSNWKSFWSSSIDDESLHLACCCCFCCNIKKLSWWPCVCWLSFVIICWPSLNDTDLVSGSTCFDSCRWWWWLAQSSFVSLVDELSVDDDMDGFLFPTVLCRSDPSVFLFLYFKMTSSLIFVIFKINRYYCHLHMAYSNASPAFCTLFQLTWNWKIRKTCYPTPMLSNQNHISDCFWLFYVLCVWHWLLKSWFSTLLLIDKKTAQ
jgi:hypothetical protein